MSKTYKVTLILAILVAVPLLSRADSVSTGLLQVWKQVGSIISPRVSTSALQVPSLASSGLCLKTDASGNFATTTCGAGVPTAWGNITGTLSNQTDLQNALNTKLSTTTAALTYQPLLSFPLSSSQVSAPGNNYQVLFNSSGNWGASSALRYNGAGTLYIGGNGADAGCADLNLTDDSGGLAHRLRSCGSSYFYNPAVVAANNIKLGVGLISPSHTLTVAGDIQASGKLYDSNDSAGLAGSVLQTTGSGYYWVATSTLGISGGPGGSVTINGLSSSSFTFATSSSSANWTVSAVGTTITYNLPNNLLTAVTASSPLSGSGTAGSPLTIDLSAYLSTTSAANTYQTKLTLPLAVASGGTGSTTLNTSLVPEGTSLYYTDARARAAVSASATPITYDSSTGKIGWTNSNSYITLSSLTGDNPIGFNQTTGHISLDRKSVV